MRKLLSVILTVAIILSSVSMIMLTASADTPNFSVTEYGASATLDTATLPSANRLSGMPLYYAYNATEGVVKEKENGNNQSSAFLYDGKLSQGFNSARDGYRYFNGLNKVNDVVKSATNSRLVLELGKVYSVNTFLVAGSKNQHPITSFEIYVGDDSATLFDSSNKVANYTRQEGSTNHQYVVTLNEAVSVKYFGVKILAVDADVFVAVDQSIYLNELGAYGAVASEVATLTAMSETPLNFGSYPYKVLNNAGTEVSNETSSRGNAKLNLWSNGKSSDSVYNLTMYNAAGMKVIYDLKNRYDVSAVTLASGGTGNYYYETKWRVYVSDSETDLFSAVNCYGMVEKSGDAELVIDKLTLSEVATCRFVGVELLENEGHSGNTGAYIAEIAIHGDDAFSTDALANITYMPGDNILYKESQTGTVTTYAKQGQNNATLDKRTDGHGTSGNVNGMYNNSIANSGLKFYNITTSDANGYHNMAVVFTTENAYTVNSVLVSIAGKEGTVSYIAYVGDNKDTLFKPENIFAKFDNEKGLYNTYTVADQSKTGTVFGILFTGYTKTATFWPDEIAFFEADNGVKASTDVVIDSKNMLDGKKLYQGSGTTVGTTEKTVDGYNIPVNRLTNGSFLDIANEGAIGGKGLRFYNGDKGANMTYDLGKNADISKIVIAGGKTTSGDNTMGLGVYGVFVADSADKANLYKLSNRVAMVVNGDYSQAHSFDLSSLDVKGQYVGILLYGIYDHYRPNTDTADTAFYLTEFGVYGNFSSDEYTVVNEPADSEVALKGTNALKNATIATEIDNAILTDGVVLTDNVANAVQIEDANGTKLTYNLGKAMDISSLLVGSVYDNANNIAPCHYRIYLANAEADLYTDAALVVEYISAGYKQNSGNYAGSAQLFELVSTRQAQFVGFEFVTATFGGTTLTLSELGAYATYNMAGELTGDITTPEKVYLDGKLVANSTNIPVDALAGNHSLVVFNGTNNNVYFVNNGVFTLKADLNNALATQGTQIRTDNPLAIRFVNSIKSDVKGNVVKYGAVAAKTAALSSKDLVVDSPDYTTVNAVAYEKGVQDIIFADNGTEISFTVAIHNISTKQHLTYYAVRPYMVIDVDGVEYTVYGETYQSRPYDVAKAALADTSANYNEKVMEYLNNIADNSSLTTVSEALYTSYGLTDESVAASVKNAAANNDRLIRVIQKAQRGEDITLGVLGGSITMGANVLKEDRYAHAYAGILREWLENTFNVNVNLVNAGIGATTSTFGVHRIEKDLLQYNPDLVVLEYAVNENESETTNKTYEDCVRRILASGDDTALMLLFTVRYNKLTDNSYNKVTCYHPEEAVSGTTTYYNNQGAQMVIGNNYNLPMISYMDCIVPLIEDETFTWKGTSNKSSNLTTDDIHPSYFGHQIIASLVTDYIATVAEGVTVETTTTKDTLPAALYGATYTNAKFYNAVDLPEEWIVSMGSFKAAHDVCDKYLPYEVLTHAWKAQSTDTAAPMVLNIPGAKSVTMLMVRTKDIADGIKATVTVTPENGSKVSKNASNYLNSSSYADTNVIWTAEQGEDITLTIDPVFGDKEGELVILGIMVGFDEA